MDERTYTKREQDHFNTDIHTRLTRQDEMLVKILEQATKTNGRVTKLEDWKNAIAWGFGLLTTVSLFIVNKLWN